MSRSVKKGPYVEPKLLKRVEELIYKYVWEGISMKRTKRKS